MKIMLINPSITGEERYGKFDEVGGYSPPLGICYLAAVLEKEGYEVRILDAEVLKLNMDQVLDRVKKFNPFIVGVNANTITAYKALRTIQSIKEKMPSVVTIMGGAHISGIPKKTMEVAPALDIGVIGEGEQTILELVRCIKKQSNPKDVKGIIFRKNNKLIQTPPRQFIKNIDSIPHPARHLLPDLRLYHPTPQTYKRLPVTGIITSRGCPYGCIFCDKSVFGRSIRYHSANYVIEEIEDLISKYKIKEIEFYDDTFTVNKKRLFEICDRLKDHNIIYTIASRVDTLSKDVVRKLARAGCWQIAIGIESGDQRILNLIEKGITLQQVKDAVRIIKEEGMEAKGFFMIGHPGDTLESINKTIKFATSLPLDHVLFTITTPLPGTKLYHIARKYGTFEEQDWSKFSMWDTIYIPHGLSKKLLKRKQMEAYKKFYLRPRNIINNLMKIRSFGDLKMHYLATKTLLK